MSYSLILSPKYSLYNDVKDVEEQQILTTERPEPESVLHLCMKNYFIY